MIPQMVKFFLARIFHRTKSILDTGLFLKVSLFSLNTPQHFLLWRYWAIYILLFTSLDLSLCITGDYKHSCEPKSEPFSFQTDSEWCFKFSSSIFLNWILHLKFRRVKCPNSSSLMGAMDYAENEQLHPPPRKLFRKYCTLLLFKFLYDITWS